MAKIEDITVTLTLVTKEFGYQAATAQASLTRLSRAMWLTLPRWRRWWLTLRRRGW